MKGKFIFGIVVLVMLFITISIAANAIPVQDFEADITTIKDRIFSNEEAIFNFLITSRSNVSFKLELPQDPQFKIRTEPTVEEFFLDEGETKRFKIKILPRDNVEFGEHNLKLTIVGNEFKLENALKITVLNPEGFEGTFLPHVEVDPESEYPQGIDPNKPVELKLRLINKNSLTIPELIVKMSTSFFEEEKITSFEPYEVKEVDFSIDIGPDTPPQEETITIRLVVNGEIITLKEFETEVLPINLDLEEKTKESTGFLKREVTYKLRNAANLRKAYTFSVPSSFWGRLVSKPMPEAEAAKGSYVWELELDGNETVIIKVVYNFLWIFIIIILIIALIFLFQYFKPDISVRKEITELNREEDGMFRGAKIVLYVKNKTTHTLKNIKITEKIPRIVAYLKRELPESISPHVIPRQMHTELIWHLSELIPKEERIFSYNIRAVRSAVGEIRIVPTEIQFDKIGIRKFVLSNSLRVVTIKKREVEE